MVCYGHQWDKRQTGKCARCGHSFYEHSHLETLMANGRVRRDIIRLRVAPGARTGEENGDLVYRSAYDRMMDRQESIVFEVPPAIAEQMHAGDIGGYSIDGQDLEPADPGGERRQQGNP